MTQPKINAACTVCKRTVAQEELNLCMFCLGEVCNDCAPPNAYCCSALKITNALENQNEVLHPVAP